jgi:histidinol-phosphate aminotransferase
MLKPRPAVAKLVPYQSPIVTRAGLPLDLNESMAGCSTRVLNRLHSLSVEELSRYPHRETGERLIADFLGLASDQVLLTNGMDEGLSLLFAAYLGPDDRVLFADPTFVMYPILANSLGAKITRLQSPADLALPVDRFLASISPRTRLIAIANPNNPTGSVARGEDLLKIADAAPHAAVLIDEAYFDFYGGSVISDLAAHPNLFIGRTFSKAYGLAGLRLGVIAGPAVQIDYLRRFALPFNVNSAVLACLEAALSDQDFVRDHVAQVKQGRARLEQLLAELHLEFWPSQTNFVLVRIGDRVHDFLASMRHRGFVLRDQSSNSGCQGCARMTIGTPAQMDMALEAFRESIAEIRR